MKQSQIIQRLNDLLQDPNFQELENLLPWEFNIFQFIGIEETEPNYSKILSKLFDPYKNYGLGDSFLREFLKMVFREEKRKEKLKNLSIEYIDIDCANFDSINVWNEKTILSKKRIDVLVEMDLDNEKWILAIENKIRHEESENQTINYTKELSRNYPENEYKKICLFLTPDGKMASSEEFLPFTWLEVYKVLDYMDFSNLKENFKNFLNHLKYSIKVYIMNQLENEERVNELLKKLFNKHSEILGFLYEKYPEYAKYYITEIIRMLEGKFKEKYGDQWEYFIGKNWIRFNNKEWHKKQQEEEWVDGKIKYFSLFDFRIEIYNDKLYLIITSHGNSAEFLRKEFKEKLIQKIKGNNLPFKEAKLNEKPDERAVLTYTFLENVEDEDTDVIINETLKKVDEIMKYYIPQIEDILEGLSKEL